MKEKNTQDLIREFKSKINEYENVLFGMSLFIQGICFMWEHKKEIIELNQQHYENAKKRMSKVINEAKKLLEETEQHPDRISSLQQFQFPLISGHLMLDEGTQRFEALARVYNELFPKRPKDKPLTKEEHRQLFEVTIKKWNVVNY